MSKDPSEDYLNFHRKYKDFNNSFSNFQLMSRQNQNYYEFEAYRDLKICISLYSEVFDLLGFQHLKVSPKTLNRIIENFNCFEKRELIFFFINKLSLKGNLEIENQFSHILVKQDIICSWQNLKNGNSIFPNFCLIVFKTSSYNIYTLIFSLILLFILISLIFLPAPYAWMELLYIVSDNFSNVFIFNHISIALLYFFDIGDHIKVTPLNFWAVLILITLKTLIVLVVGNFLFKEIIRKIKFS